MFSKNISISQALKEATIKLTKAKINSVWLDAELLLAFILKKDRNFVLAHNEEKLTYLQYKKYKNLIKKRANYWPLAYLVGNKEFYSLDFKVTKDTLVPRPESELLVEAVLKLINKNTVLIDLGTGSGCLIISALVNTKIKPKKALAIDISSQALKIARANAKKHKIKNIEFKKSDLLNNVKLKSDEQYIILANLPYVASSLMKEKSIQKEPKLALHGGRDGLNYYRKLKKQLPKNALVLCEINPGQKLGFKKIWPKAEFKKDLSGKIRLGIIKK